VAQEGADNGGGGEGRGRGVIFQGEPLPFVKVPEEEGAVERLAHE